MNQHIEFSENTSMRMVISNSGFSLELESRTPSYKIDLHRFQGSFSVTLVAVTSLEWEKQQQQKHKKVLLNSFHLNGHTLGFWPLRTLLPCTSIKKTIQTTDKVTYQMNSYPP